LERGEIDEGHAVGEVVAHTARNGQGEACLANAAGTG
jgi:hypothetical protein